MTEDRVYLNMDRMISPRAFTFLGKILSSTLRGGGQSMVIHGKNLKLTSQVLFELQDAVSFLYKDPVTRRVYTYPVVKDFTLKVNSRGELIAIHVRFPEELPELAQAFSEQKQNL